jgi:hypothetical protein
MEQSAKTAVMVDIDEFRRKGEAIPRPATWVLHTFRELRAPHVSVAG